MQGDIPNYVRTTAARAREASRLLATVSPGQKNRWLLRVGELIRSRGGEVLDANQQDLRQAAEYGLSDAAVDRLRLTDSRMAAIAEAVEQISLLPDPVGEIIEGHVRPNGLQLRRVRVPLGVVFFIYESRPNVTVDAAALCVKSGNAVILRGGKEALHSNLAFHRLISDALADVDLPRDAVQLVETTDRDVVGQFLQQGEFIDVTIPRGGKSLIERVTREATMPVIKHFDGNCHIYVDRLADFDMATAITINAKCQRPGVCNAAESLLVHADIAESFLPRIAASLREQHVVIKGCERSRQIVPNIAPATDDDFRREFLDLTISVKVVADLDTAIRHINDYGSHHTDAIITSDLRAADRFTTAVDSAAVLINASTRFNDGGEFGLGAEIGISTDKFHARGPCGLRELTSYKYIVQGTGQTRT